MLIMHIDIAYSNLEKPIHSAMRTIRPNTDAVSFIGTSVTLGTTA